MKKLQKILSIVTVVSVFCVNMAFAAEESPDAEKSNPSVRVTNNLTTGDIRFHIEESYDEQGKNAYDTSKPRIVVPGQKVNKYVHIVNDAEKAWLRVKVDFDTENDSIDMDEFMLSVADGWEKIGDYWYYKYPADEPDGVEKGGKVLFLNGFSIPSSLGDEVVDGKFELNFQVEAVQTAHFTPDWTSDIDPWNGTIIEYCEHTDSYTLKGTNDAPLTIEYRGGSQGLVRMVDGVDNADDFFSNWARFMPGDTFTGTFNVQNKTAKSVTIYFHTEVGNSSEESEEIPEAAAYNEPDGAEAATALQSDDDIDLNNPFENPDWPVTRALDLSKITWGSSSYERNGITITSGATLTKKSGCGTFTTKSKSYNGNYVIKMNGSSDVHITGSEESLANGAGILVLLFVDDSSSGKDAATTCLLNGEKVNLIEDTKKISKYSGPGALRYLLIPIEEGYSFDVSKDSGAELEFAGAEFYAFSNKPYVPTPEPTVAPIPTEPPLSAEEKLLSTCSLKITSDDGAVIFDGPMSTVLDHPIAIGQFTKDTEKQFAFEVSIPAWLPNAYSLREAQTVWIFETAYSNEFTLPDTGGSGNAFIYPIMAAVGIIAFIAFKRRFKQ